MHTEEGIHPRIIFQHHQVKIHLRLHSNSPAPNSNRWSLRSCDSQAPVHYALIMLKQCNSIEDAQLPRLFPLNVAPKHSMQEIDSALPPVALWVNLAIKAFTFLRTWFYNIGFYVYRAPSPSSVSVTTLMNDGSEAGDIDGSLGQRSLNIWTWDNILDTQTKCSSLSLSYILLSQGCCRDIAGAPRRCLAQENGSNPNPTSSSMYFLSSFLFFSCPFQI